MIKIYSIPECPYCTTLKEKLDELNIDYTDVNVMLDENEEEYDKLYEKTKSDSVPIIKVSKYLLIPEKSFRTIEEAVTIIKKLIGNN